jgi:hypothetical protein
MMRTTKFIFMFLLVIMVSGCLEPNRDGIPGGDGPDRLLMMTWNCQNLFDGVHDGTEYPEFDPALGKWTDEMYRTRLLLAADIIRSAGGEGPDILFLQEVENRCVVEDLNEVLGRDGFRWIFVTEEKDRAIQLAVLSRWPLEGIRLWQPGFFNEESLRPVVELQVVLGNERMILFNNHWKSKREGVPETEPARCLSAAVLTARISGGTLCCAAGDFNTELNDRGTAGADEGGGNQAFCSWPDQGAPAGRILLTADRSRFGLGDFPDNLMYETWGESTGEGSYYFNGEWSRPDHFLLSAPFFDGAGWEFESMTVCGNPVLVAGSGAPLRWITETGEGYSDHLPLLLCLVRLSGE